MNTPSLPPGVERTAGPSGSESMTAGASPSFSTSNDPPSRPSRCPTGTCLGTVATGGSAALLTPTGASALGKRHVAWLASPYVVQLPSARLVNSMPAAGCAKNPQGKSDQIRGSGHFY